MSTRQLTFFHDEAPTCYKPGSRPDTLAYTPSRPDGLDRNLRDLKWIDIHFGRAGCTRVCSGMHTNKWEGR